MPSITTLLPRLRPSLPATLGTALGGISLAVLVACGGGTTSDHGAAEKTTVSNTTVVQSGLRALPESFGQRRAVSYSPYRTATRVEERDQETITDAMVKEDLDLLVKAGIGLIRLFDSSDKVAARTLRVIKANNLDLKVMLGAYVNSFEYANTSATNIANIQTLNSEEVARCVALANAYPETVVAVSVGNETLVDWSFVPVSTKRLAQYIKTVRDQIVQPVTTDDNYAVYAGKITHHAAVNNIAEVLAQIDFASIHSYAIEDVPYSNFNDSDAWPDWDAKQSTTPNNNQRAVAMMDAAIAKTQKDYRLARSYLDTQGKAQLPIVIGETGWKAADPSGTGRYKYLANPANQKMYYDRLLAWVDNAKTTSGPKNIIYFEAFDEPWKGSDDKWGLFNVKRQARFAVQGKHTPSSNWTYEYKTGTTAYTASDAVYYADAIAKDPVSASRYTLYADANTTGEIRAKALTPDLQWDAYEGSTASRNEQDTSQSPADGPNSLRITPTPKDFGWGLLLHSANDTSDNLSAFQGGTLNFSIKTLYAGKLEIGIQTDTSNRDGAQAYVALGNGQYGYCNTGNWCQVSIPLSAFSDPANPRGNSNLDLRYVLTRFSISDVYKNTGNAASTANTANGNNVVNIDAIYWQK